jgi:pre-mRNA-splicing factor 18
VIDKPFPLDKQDTAMDLLKAEIAKKKAQAEALRKQAASETVENGVESSSSPTEAATNPSTNSKFIRQKDRMLWNQKQLEEEQRRLDEEREQRKRQKLEHETERNTKLHKQSLEEEKKAPVRTTSHNVQEEEDEENAIVVEELAKNPVKYVKLRRLSPAEVKTRLRQLYQPITIFGETDSERITRYIRHRILAEKKIGSSQQDAGTIDEDRIVTQQSDQDDDDDDDLENQQNDTDANHPSGSNHPASSSSGHHNDSDEDSADHNQQTGNTTRSSSSKNLLYDPTVQYHTKTDLSPEKIIYKFFRSLIKQWEYDLREKAATEKLTAKGKNEIRTQKQCKDYIRPLFKLCKEKQVPYDILQKLGLMVKYCELGNFVKANDEYIKTAIGNSAWPIGLTMVGIHERSGRERISTSKVCETSLLLELSCN